jgi:pyruvate dehydrogenase E2 component (dihydrolipoamide acetyltransferase)
MGMEALPAALRPGTQSPASIPDLDVSRGETRAARTEDVAPLGDVRGERLLLQPCSRAARLVPAATVTDALLAACAAVLRAHPALNAHCDGEAVTVFDEVHLGLAVATDGGLVVPVVHGAGALDLAGLAAARRDVVGRARTGKLRSADIAGGTFTVSNLGILGIDYFDAILNIPQVAILAVGATTQRQVWNGGDPAWRPVAQMTLTCDHRAVDGATGAGFLSTLRDLLQAA